MSEEVSSIGSEFQSLPLEFIVAAPLTAAVQAQAAAAATTMGFLEKLKGQTVDFSAQVDAGGGSQASKKITVPFITCVPVPHLGIDELSTHFKFEISQLVKDTDRTSVGVEASASAAGLPWLNLSLKGNLTHEASREATTNKSGLLEITVHASESDMPAGLQKVLDWLTSTIPTSTTTP